MKNLIKLNAFILVFFLNMSCTEVDKPENVPANAIWDNEFKIWLSYNNKSEFLNWYKNGAKAAIAKIINGQLNGKATFWYENGNKSCEGFFINHEKHGIWTIWHENGKLNANGTYKNDIVDGKWIFYNINGKKEKIIKYKNGEIIYNHRIGDPERPKAVSVDANWNTEEQLWDYTYYDKKNNCNVFHRYFQNGKTAEIFQFTDDYVFNGKCMLFYESGIKAQEGLYLNGKENNLWIYYDENGYKIGEIEYKDGEKIFKKVYSVSGKLLGEVLFENNEVISEKIY